MDCKTLYFSRHAFERMFQRGINPDAVAQVITQAEVIVVYPDDEPYPSTLLLGIYANQPIHAVVARESATGKCHLVTIYWPDLVIWDESFKKRRA